MPEFAVNDGEAALEIVTERLRLVYDRKPFQRVSRFRAAERSAREAGRGVWGRCGGDFHSGG